MIIRCELYTEMPEQYAGTVHQWLVDLPAFAKKLMNRIDQPIEIFRESFRDDLNCLVFADGKLTGFCQGESLGDKTFEIHLFCARKTPAEVLYACVSGFFEEMKRTRGVKRLVFNVRRRQKLLRQCIIDHGAEPTGESHIDEKQTFEQFLWYSPA